MLFAVMRGEADVEKEEDMREYIDLELLKLRANVLEAAMRSNMDLEFYVKSEFTALMSDLREAWCLVTNEEDE